MPLTDKQKRSMVKTVLDQRARESLTDTAMCLRLVSKVEQLLEEQHAKATSVQDVRAAQEGEGAGFRLASVVETIPVSRINATKRRLASKARYKLRKQAAAGAETAAASAGSKERADDRIPTNWSVGGEADVHARDGSP